MVNSTVCRHWQPSWWLIPVALIIAVAPPAAVAAKAATSAIPIVFTMGTDPVDLGLVSSFNRPGGNVSGVNFLVTTLAAKRLDRVGRGDVPTHVCAVGALRGAAFHLGVRAEWIEIKRVQRPHARS